MPRPDLPAATDLPPADQTPRELAQIVKAWRDAADLPVSRAAQLIGIPARTLEGIEQGRGFRYPLLLIHAIRSFK